MQMNDSIVFIYSVQMVSETVDDEIIDYSHSE